MYSLIPKHDHFLAWRGMKVRPVGDPMASLGDVPLLARERWPRMRLGCEEDWWDTEAMGDEEGDDGDVEPPLPVAELQAAREAAAERLGGWHTRGSTASI